MVKDARLLFFFSFSLHKISIFFARLSGLNFGQRIAIFAIFFKQSIFHHLVAAAPFSPFAALNVRIVYYIRFPPTDTASYWDKSLISSILDCLVRINDLKSSSMFADIWSWYTVPLYHSQDHRTRPFYLSREACSVLGPTMLHGRLIALDDPLHVL